jgi:hypothetical protein
MVSATDPLRLLSISKTGVIILVVFITIPVVLNWMDY